MNRSMRDQLLVGAGAVLIAVTLVICGLVYVLARSALQQESAARLKAETRALASMIHYEADGVRESMPESALDLGVQVRGVIQIQSATGAVLARSPGLDQVVPFSSNVRDLELVPGERWLAWSVRFQPVVEVGPPAAGGEEEEEEHEVRERAAQSAPGPFTLRVGNHTSYYQDAVLPSSQVLQVEDVPKQLQLTLAMDVTGVERELSHLALMLVVSGVTALVLGLVVLSRLIGRVWQPIGELARRVETVGNLEATAAELLPLGDAPIELVPLVDGVNLLLRRVRATVEREKAFSADIAHELRTPLTGLRTGIDVCLRRERDPEAYRQALEEGRQQCLQLQGMVGTLLELARLDTPAMASGSHPIAAEIPLRPTILHLWESVAARAAERQLTLTCEVGEEVVAAEPERFERILANLLENAVAYCDEAGRIVVSAAAGGGRIRLRVANTGSRVEAADAEKVFDRFWRGDRARTGAGINAGLGLCLCQLLVRLLGGTISATSVPGGEFTIMVELPGRSSGRGSAVHRGAASSSRLTSAP